MNNEKLREMVKAKRKEMFGGRRKTRGRARPPLKKENVSDIADNFNDDDEKETNDV